MYSCSITMEWIFKIKLQRCLEIFECIAFFACQCIYTLLKITYVSKLLPEISDLYWTQIMFSDESRFLLYGTDGRVRVWRRRGERNLPPNLLQTCIWRRITDGLGMNSPEQDWRHFHPGELNSREVCWRSCAEPQPPLCTRNWSRFRVNAGCS